MKISHYAVPTEMKNILLNTPEVTEMVGGNISPVIASEDTEGDYIALQRDGFKQERNKMGLTYRWPFVYVYIVSADSQRSQDIAERVKEALEGKFYDPDIDIYLEDDSEEYESGKYIQVLKFLVII